MTDTAREANRFRLDLEQQRKRAKDLLKAVLAGEAGASARLLRDRRERAPVLADAQRAIAHEHGCRSWSELKTHIAAMERERRALADGGTPPDGDQSTLHVRCGSDIRATLVNAGFTGDFLEHAYPYAHGPVSEGAASLEERARFLAGEYGGQLGLEYESLLADLRAGEEQLLSSACYARVVIWSEHDTWDQLALLRLLAHYALHARPAALELVTVTHFPGDTPFRGLAQLPPEALRLLWERREPARPAQLQLGLAGWRALLAPDPRALAALARATPQLPPLAAALRRHLQELPAPRTGLSLTETLLLQLLADRPRTVNELFHALNDERDPLPGQGDLQVLQRIEVMERASQRPFERARGGERSPWSDLLAITPTGRAVLSGEIDWLSLSPPVRHVGGVRIGAGAADWRWDDARGAAVMGTRGSSEKRPCRSAAGASSA